MSRRGPTRLRCGYGDPKSPKVRYLGSSKLVKFLLDQSADPLRWRTRQRQQQATYVDLTAPESPPLSFV